MAVTIRKIAEITGVSRGTVDRVLNHRGSVNAATESLILKTAEELGYRPNLAGKALAARKKRYVIGVILCSEENEFFDEVISGINWAERECADYGITLKRLAMKGYDTERQLELLDSIRGKVDLVILNAINEPAVKARIDEMNAQGIRFITVNTEVEGGDVLCHVGIDYRQSGSTAAGIMRLIIPEGARIAVAMGSKNILGHNQRVEGFTRTIAERCPGDRIVTVFETKDDVNTAYQRMKDALDKYSDINAVYITSGGQKGVCRAVAESGRDISVVTSDATQTVRDNVNAGIIKATICQEPFRQGYCAVHTAVQYLVYGELPEPDSYAVKNEIKIYENI
jgi:LacI family transcriptional regulator